MMPFVDRMTPHLDLLASLSRLAIAGAVVYFAWQLGQINSNVGNVTETVDRVTEQIPPTLAETRAIRLEVAGLSEQIPDILAVVEAARGEIPAVLAEIEAVNAQVDPILQRFDESLLLMREVLQQLPDVLSTTNAAIASLEETRDQSVPLVLEEIRLARELIDPTLDRIDVMMDDAFEQADVAISGASRAGQEASEGAVTGFFTGLLRVPFQLVGTLAAPLVRSINTDVIEQLNEEDARLMAEAGARAGISEDIGRDYLWSNPETGNSGAITIVSKLNVQGVQCVNARIRINNRGTQIQDKTSEFCRDSNDSWKLREEIVWADL